MAGPGGKQLGRVSVRVVPDTDKFRDELKGKLERMKDPKFQVEVEPNTRGFERKVRAAIQAAEKMNRLTIDVDADRVGQKLDEAFKDRRVKVGVDVDRDAVESLDKAFENAAKIDDVDFLDNQALKDSVREVDGLDRSAKNVNKTFSEVKTTVAGLERQFGDAGREAIKFAHAAQIDDINVKFDADERALLSKLAAAKQKIDETRESLEKINARKAIQIDLDTSKAQAQVKILEARIDELSKMEASPKIDAQIALALAQLEELHVKLRDLEAKRVEITANVDVDDAELKALEAKLLALQAQRRKITLQVDVDRDKALSKVGSALEGIINQFAKAGSSAGEALFKTLGSVASILPGNFERVFQTASDGFGKLGDAADLAGKKGAGAGGAILSALQAVVQAGFAVVSTLFTLGAMSFALLVAGAAITAAWGTVATAIAAVPAALVLVAAPLAAVMLGMDGIKKAAKQLQKPFDDLKASVSKTFEKGLAPVFKQLATIFPTLTAGMNQVASSVVNVASGLVRIVSSAAGIGQLNAIFAAVSTAITGITPGLQDIVAGFLQVASMKEAFSVFTGVINTFGSAFKASVSELSNGTLQSAFTGLQGVLEALTRGFVGLVENGIKVFAAAAPGVKSFIDELTNFFNRFDWNSLGQSVGKVFQGLGDVFKNIPQSTIDAFATSFQKVGDLFADPSFQANIGQFVQALPGLIDGVRDLASAFSTILGPLAEFISYGTKDDDPPKFLSQRPQQVGTFITPVPQQVGSLLQPTGAAVSAATADVPKLLQQNLTPSAPTLLGIQQVPDQVGTLLQPTAPAAGAATAGVPTAVQTSVAPTTGVVQQEMGNAAAAATAGGQQISDASKSAFAKVPANAKEAMAMLTSAVKESLAVLGPEAAAKMESIVAGINAGMQLVDLAFTQGWDNAKTKAVASLGEIATAVTEKFALIRTEMTNFTTSSTAFTQFFTDLKTSVVTNMTEIATAFTTGLAGITTSASSGMILVKAAFDTGWQNVSTGINTAFVGINSTVLGNMATIATTVTGGFAGITAAFTTGFSNSQAAVTAALAGIGSSISFALQGMAGLAATQAAAIGTAIATGISNAAAAVAASLTQIVSAFQTGFATVVTVVTDSMNQVTQAITSGMQTATQAVTSGIQQMVSALQAGVSQFRAAGENMGQALADGLNSKLGAVQAAAAALASAAAAALAAAAQIHSPSRVFIKLGRFIVLGFALGIDRHRHYVISSIYKLVKVTKSAMAGFSEIFEGELPGNLMGDKLSDVMAIQRAQAGTKTYEYKWVKDTRRDDWGHHDYGRDIIDALHDCEFRFDRDGIARIVNNSNTRKKRR